MPSSNLSSSPRDLHRRTERTESPGPTRQLLTRNHSVKALLPAGDEVIFSTRGQALPVLISHLSSALRPRELTHRGSFFVGPDDVQHDIESAAGTRRGSEEFERAGPAPLSRRASWYAGESAGEMTRSVTEDRRRSEAILFTSQMRSIRLIGNSNPRYRWEQYWTTDDELKKMKRPLRAYYERNNSLIQQYVYIDRLLDSSLPHDLIQEYQLVNTAAPPLHVPSTISEESPVETPSAGSTMHAVNSEASLSGANGHGQPSKINRTPKNLYKVHERTPLLANDAEEDQERLDTQPEEEEFEHQMPKWDPEDEGESEGRIVQIAIYINLLANTILLILKIIVTLMTSSVSVLAALVDAILDFLSTAIVWTTTRLVSAGDDYQYPIGRRRLEPIGVLVFSVIMITAFAQVAFAGIGKLTDENHTVVELGTPAIVIMLCTVLVKGLCWLWCRLIKNSSVQALAQDAVTDVVFNTFSIIFPLIGYYAQIWWLDPVGGILLSCYVIYAWSQTTLIHIRNLTGAACTADERNVLLYLTMRFAKTIKQIQGLQAYHSGDRINVEVDLVLDENMTLKDAHDLGESLQYVLESVPTVERAFVHLDYSSQNLPTHMRQDN